MPARPEPGTLVEVDPKQFNAAGSAQQKKLRGYRDQLIEDPFLGDRIARAKSPQRFKDLPNLFRLELPQAWRALYTVATQPGKPTVIRVVWIGTHKKDDRLFGYS